ncbi:MAG: hypothetical protein WCY71_08745 [Halothiobacillaceae bacterium]
MNDRELSREIKKCAEYLIEKQSRDEWLTGRDLEPGEAITLRDDLKMRLEKAERLADELLKITEPLCVMTELGRAGIVFGSIQQRARQAQDHAVMAKVEISRAIRECIPAPRTRAMELQRSAARLAYGLAGEAQPRKVREVAMKIITEAKLDQPSDRALTNWISEEKEKDRLSVHCPDAATRQRE